MDFPKVQITTTDAKLGMNSSRPPIEISQRPAEVNMEQNFRDTVHISTEDVKVHIDQSEVFADAGMLPPLEQAKQSASRAEQTATEYIAKTAREGEQMKSIHENGGGGAVFASIAKQNSRVLELDTEMSSMPQNVGQVKFEVDPASISFDVEKAEVNIDAKVYEPEFQVPRWEVQHYLRQKPSIEINVVGVEVNRAI
ncbi:hypothetical protein D7Z54_28460 [Salibacterium salarium]|uniref:YviE n=1 Tax=Salibacterium salarium TaxID=284579 RepID=A0A428MV19_9BACI|nr:DUF6470 family protein [Salibacterium salarium]RSL29957.1 hypothetical protein D7Z54_28460 [Salibacterium salarium]